MADTVTVNLKRSYQWVEGDSRDGTPYGPGEVAIPRAMAEGLVGAGVLDKSVLGEDGPDPNNYPPDPDTIMVVDEEEAEEAKPLERLSIPATLQAIEDGRFTVEEVLAAEQAKDEPRATLISELEKRQG